MSKEAHLVPALGKIQVEIVLRGLASLTMMLLIPVLTLSSSLGFPQFCAYQSELIQNL